MTGQIGKAAKRATTGGKETGRRGEEMPKTKGTKKKGQTKKNLPWGPTENSGNRLGLGRECRRGGQGGTHKQTKKDAKGKDHDEGHQVGRNSNKKKGGLQRGFPGT